MTGLTNFMVKRIATINAVRVARRWYNANIVSEEQIKCVLKARFPNAVNINVADVSGGCGAMFEIYVESPDFKGLTIVKQHKSVYDALKNEMKQIHGLHLVTKASN